MTNTESGSSALSTSALARKVMLVVNPRSGRGLSKFAIGIIVSHLCESGCAVTVYFSGEKSPGDLVLEHADLHEMVVCVGGDGTFNAVVSGLMRSGAPIPLGYIPSGTANDIASTLGISKIPREAVKTIKCGKPRPLDIGLFSDRHFTYIAAFGAFTGVAYSTPQNAKRSLGHFAYVLGGLADVPAIKARRTVVEYDGNVIEGDYIFGGVMNSTSVAGLVKLDPNIVDLADGLFEVVLVRQPIDLAAFLDILASLATQSYNGDNVQMLHAAKVKFSFDEEVAWTVDGEDGGKHREVSITNCHKAIEIIV